MEIASTLPHPNLAKFMLGEILAYSDESLYAATGLRIAFTGRQGGFSQGPYGGLNLGTHVNDDLETVMRNRAVLLGALGDSEASLVVPNQVHGTTVVTIGSESEVPQALEAAAAGVDAVVVNAAGIASALCFADCLPVIVVAPDGSFAIAHAGWRGAVAGIAGKAARALADAYAAKNEVDPRTCSVGFNAYIGPYIHSECFEVGVEVVARFREAFGDGCIRDERHVSLGAAVAADLQTAGLQAERIADVDECTMCAPEEFFSYRASGGTCGRHAAAAMKARD